MYLKASAIASIAFKFQLILYLLIVFFTMCGNEQMVSLSFYITFFVLVVNFFAVSRESNFNEKYSMDMVLLLMMIVFAFLAITIVIQPYNTSFDYFTYLKKYLMFCSTLMFLYIAARMTVHRELINYILKINYILSALYISFYFLGEKRYYGGGITLNFSNPQLLALFLVNTALYLIIALKWYKSIFLRIVSISTFCVIVRIIIETRSRTAWGGLAVFTILSLFTLVRKNFKIRPLFSVVLILSPLLFAIIYLMKIKDFVVTGFFDFVESPGKIIVSRVQIWSNAFEIIRENPIVGDYYGISGGTGMSQLHNTHLDVLASYGCLVFILFIVYLCRIVLRTNRGCETKLQKIALLSFFTIIILGFGEAAFVSGSLGMYILSCSFLLIARYKETSDNLQTRHLEEIGLSSLKMGL